MLVKRERTGTCDEEEERGRGVWACGRGENVTRMGVGRTTRGRVDSMDDAKVAHWSCV
jgi:hypothetical protein